MVDLGDLHRRLEQQRQEMLETADDGDIITILKFMDLALQGRMEPVSLDLAVDRLVRQGGQYRISTALLAIACKHYALNEREHADQMERIARSLRTPPNLASILSQVML